MIYESFKVESESSAGKFYTVSKSRVLVDAGGGTLFHGDAFAWQCSCLGWTRHVPRRDCKHIEWVKAFGGIPVDPLIAAVEKKRRRAGVL